MYFQIILLTLFCSSVLSDEFCETKAQSYKAYDLADNLVVETHTPEQPTKYWFYVSEDRALLDVAEEYRKEVFKGIDPKESQVIISFGEDKANRLPEKARNLVIVQMTGPKQKPFPYKLFKRVANDKDLEELKSQEDTPWNWSPSGDDISRSIFPEMNDKWIYTAGVFSPPSKTMIVVIKKDENQFQVKQRKLNDDGNWDNWKDLNKVGFEGLFILNDTLGDTYGIIPYVHSIVKFSLNLTYHDTVPLKLFFGCKASTESPKPSTRRTTQINTTEDTTEGQTQSQDSTVYDELQTTTSSAGTSGFSVFWVIFWIILVILILIAICGLIKYIIVRRNSAQKLNTKDKKDEPSKK